MKELFNALPLPNDSPVTALAVVDDVGKQLIFTMSALLSYIYIHILIVSKRQANVRVVTQLLPRPTTRI